MEIEGYSKGQHVTQNQIMNGNFQFKVIKGNNKGKLEVGIKETHNGNA